MPAMPFLVRALVAATVLFILFFPTYLIGFFLVPQGAERPLVGAAWTVVLAGLMALMGGIAAWAVGGFRGKVLAVGAVIGLAILAAVMTWGLTTQV